MAQPQPAFTQLTPHIYKLDLPYFGGRLPVGVFLVRDDNAAGGRGGWILVDAGAPGFVDTVLEQVSKVTGAQPPHLLVLTHGHLDHAAAAEAIRRRWKIPIAAGRDEITYLTGPAAYASIPAKSPIYRVAQISPPALVGRNVQIPLDDGMHLHGLQVVHAPGHAPGMVALLHAADRALLSADVFYNLGGKLGDPAGLFTYDPALNHASQERLVALDFDHLIPSHGPAILNTGRQAAQAVVEGRNKKKKK
jgi:glyoxylase-like metal-dependent hydrolase (beta-lactamase superfamily II)